MEELDKVDTCSKCGSQFHVPMKNKAVATCLECGYKFKYVNGEKTGGIPPKTANELINETNKYLTVGTTLFTITFVASLFVAIYSDAILLYILAAALFSCIYSTAKELWLFKYSFRNPEDFLVNWEYPNGDRLIIGCWGLLKTNAFIPKLSVSANFEGFKWDADNAQELLENLTKQGGNPLLALIPSIEFSTSWNRVDDYLFFDTSDKVKIIFIYKDRGYLMICLEKNNKKYKLTYPLPSLKQSLEEEAKIFEERFMNRRTIIKGWYIERSQVEEILSKNNSL